MNKQQIVERLLALPAEIDVAEGSVLEANLQVLGAKGTLQAKEDMLLFGTAIDGKNAEIRAAQMRQHTQDERGDLEEAELHLKNAVTSLGRLRDEFKALMAVVDLLKGAA
ncbi:hypothetical protein PAT3040_04122 [Paenibacillus agaridevorans]|uniref:Uncharacterized protein n=1 Tax=Paenibacillus agaridevorans TaxID=171404 RepID=A0A2R5ERZ6_9BACL|nr:hypothetical protein [Paenibacillus agaridevorans]GBG09476.1 hypothetical protein PAT3040_04122 [Paenibacillus agaridevorans]